MPSSSTPMRIDDDITSAAKLAAAVMNRSAAQQIAHWARIGRALEMSPGVSLAAIADVLTGVPERSYDTLTVEEQAILRANWEELMAERRAELDFEAEFTAVGRSYSELDEDGNVVQRTPG